MAGQVTISTDEWQALIKSKEAAEQRAAKLDELLVEAKLDAANSGDLGMIDGFLAAYELVQFLIAHGHPDVVKSQPWPWQALVTFADTLEKLPALRPTAMNYQEAAIDMRHLATEAAAWNTLRAERKLKLSLGQDPGPEVTESPTTNP